MQTDAIELSSPVELSRIAGADRLKRSRNKSACDGCRSRKTKCEYDSGYEKCQACVLLDIECTSNRPRKKRGPKARYAIRGNKSGPHSSRAQESGTTAHDPSSCAGLRASGSTHPHHFGIAETASPCEDSLSPNTNSLLSSFAPTEIISRILDDWFERIHPLAPVLLRDQFMHRMESGEGDMNPGFCALVLSVCAATKVTLPCEDYGSIQASTCIDYIDKHRLLTHGLSHSSYSLDWCITMYNLGSAFYSSSKGGLVDVHSYRPLSEAAAGVRYLLYYEQDELSDVENQILRRLFWLLFAGSCTMDILGRLPITLMSQDRLSTLSRPSDKTHEQLYPTIPMEGNSPKSHGEGISYIPGLNCLTDILMVWQEAQSNDQTLSEHLIKLQRVMDNFPPELRWRGGLSRPSNVTYGHEVQVANLFVTSLHIRSNLVQRFGTPEMKLSEHLKIIDDLLEVLYHLRQAVFDANGRSLAPKIRDIGAAYLEQIRISGSGNLEGGFPSQEKLINLLRRLDELDHQQTII